MKIESHDREKSDDEMATGGICPVLHFHPTDRIGQDEARTADKKEVAPRPGIHIVPFAMDANRKISSTKTMLRPSGRAAGGSH
jgi:hypothetical protein